MTTRPPPSSGGCCSCGGCLATLLVLALAALAVAVLGFRAATTPYVSLAAVSTSSADATSAQQKISQVATAADQAHSSGKPAPVTITLSDGEMTSLASDALTLAGQTGSLPPIDEVVVHAAGAGTVQAQARVHFVFVTLPLYLALHLTSPDQKGFDVTVTDARLGTIPLPAGLVGGIIDQVRRQVIGRLNVAQAPAYDHASVTVGVGRITMTATLEP